MKKITKKLLLLATLNIILCVRGCARARVCNVHMLSSRTKAGTNFNIPTSFLTGILLLDNFTNS